MGLNCYNVMIKTLKNEELLLMDGQKRMVY